MIASFGIKKTVFYLFTISINSAIIFLDSGIAATPISLPKDNLPAAFSTPPEPIKAPTLSAKITNNPEQILARVDNEPITVKDIERLASNLPTELKSLPKDLLYPQLIKQLIVDRALMIAIKKEGIEKQPLIQQELDAATKSLIQQKLSQAYFIEKLKPYLTEQAIQRYYNEHYLHRPLVKELHLRQIIVQTPEIAQIVLKKLKEGQSFSSLATIYSIDLQNRKIKQGDIGWFGLSELNSAITKAISSLNVNEYTSAPIETDYGWVLFQKIGERNRPVPSLDSVKQTIKEQITKETVINLYEENLKKVHIIEY